jgi:hypothetical protein
LGGFSFVESTEDYDWLGHGIYFWENDAVRGYQWAKESRRKFANPSVVGAAIELGKCLDLTTQTGIEGVKVAYDNLRVFAEKNGTPILENKDAARLGVGNRAIRRLDCQVMNHFFKIYKEARAKDPSLEPYGTVRSLFPEGEELYPTSGFWSKTHVQICVRDRIQILGVFRVPEWQREVLGLPELY